MALADCGTANNPEMVHSLLGETIIGTMQDDQGRFVLIVRSGHGFVFGYAAQSGLAHSFAYFRLGPDDVRAMIHKRRDEIATLIAAAETLMHLSGEIKD